MQKPGKNPAQNGGRSKAASAGSRLRHPGPRLAQDAADHGTTNASIPVDVDALKGWPGTLAAGQFCSPGSQRMPQVLSNQAIDYRPTGTAGARLPSGRLPIQEFTPALSTRLCWPRVLRPGHGRCPHDAGPTAVSRFGRAEFE